ncbi:MAG: hypothetical protein AAGJ46_04615 [Planctomycetota bacterium]
MPTGDSSSDPVDRDRFYRSTTEPSEAKPTGRDFDDEFDDDGEDYELEPVDPDIIASEQRRAEEEVVRATTALDIDEVYEDANSGQDLDEFLKDFKFRFQIKHMLMGTAALAVFLSAAKLIGSSVAALMLLVLTALVVANAFLAWKDRRREAALDAKRKQLVERARCGEAGEPQADELDDDWDPEQEAFYRADDDADEEKPTFRFNFSMKQVLIALGVASVLMGILSLIGVGAAAAVLGLVAVAGLVAFAAGVQMPPMLALGWWITLLLYIGLSILGVFTSAGA